MLVLDTTTKSLEIKLGGAVATTELPFVLSYVDVATSNMSMVSIGNTNGTTSGATAVTVAAAPTTSVVRHVKFLSVQNADTATATLTLQLNDNGTRRTVAKVALSTGDNLLLAD